MGMVIGPASDFYRLRITHLDLADELDFDWREDVLWRTPPAETSSERDVWIAEAVNIAGGDIAARLAVFDDAEEAREFLGEVEEDLNELTKSQFETAWIDRHSDPDADIG